MNDDLFLLFCFFILALPFLIVLFSDRVSGAEKAAWLLAMMFISWFAWIFYMLVAPIKKRKIEIKFRQIISYPDGSSSNDRYCAET